MIVCAKFIWNQPSCQEFFFEKDVSQLNYIVYPLEKGVDSFWKAKTILCSIS